MKKNSIVQARNLRIGSEVEISDEIWHCRGMIEVFDGDFDSLRIMFSSPRSPCRYMFLSPYTEFIYSDGFHFYKPF